MSYAETSTPEPSAPETTPRARSRIYTERRVISIAIEGSLHDELKEQASKRGLTLSALIGRIAFRWVGGLAPRSRP